VDILGLDRSDLEAAAFNNKVSPSQTTHFSKEIEMKQEQEK
jgi:hypothetical protein